MRYGVMAAVAALAVSGCTEVRYVGVPVVPTPVKTPYLQACADHAANAQRAAFGDVFTSLQFDSANLLLTSPDGKVGNQEVGAVYDGDGAWYGRPMGTNGEWRRVRFHCMVSTAGQVVYSFVRAE
jgi:hypothetical protein